jgi:hypothetical protein
MIFDGLDPWNADDRESVRDLELRAILAKNVLSWVLRNPQLVTIEKPISLERVRYDNLSRHQLGKFFKNFLHLTKNLPDWALLNCDEVGAGGRANSNISTKIALRLCSDHNLLPIRKTGCTGKHVTFMPFVAASGNVAATWIVAKGAEAQRRRLLPVAACYPNHRLILSPDSASVTKVIMEQHLLPTLEGYRTSLGKGRADRLLLVLDGHRSRFSCVMLRALERANVHLLLLPAHATHILQPIDTNLAKSMKRGGPVEAQQVKQGIRAGRQSTMADAHSVMSRFASSVSRALTMDKIRGAWRDTGLYPFDMNLINRRMLAPPTWSEFLLTLRMRPSVNSQNVALNGAIATPDHDYSGYSAYSYGGDVLTSEDAMSRLEARQVSRERGPVTAENSGEPPSPSRVTRRVRRRIKTATQARVQLGLEGASEEDGHMDSEMCRGWSAPVQAVRPCTYCGLPDVRGHYMECRNRLK